jgi:16S rRNA (adenine1518-N6/adenine1519-N6)-dimethyltransferase
LIEARRLRLKKRFSQNFLINEAVLQAIVDALDLSPEEPVLEIGPGGGFLTEALLKTGANVTAVELDRAMCRHLREKFVDRPNFRLVEDDFLRFEPDDTLKEASFKIVGNLPYGITSRILFKLVGEIEQVHYPMRERVRQLTVMVQKEVGERIVAEPGQKAYNALSIALQLRFEPRLECLVPARNFYPAPKVDSAVVTLLPRSEPLIRPDDLALFARLIRGAFSAKRKTLRNALLQSRFADAAVLDRAFEASGVYPGLRAEALSIAAFGDLAHAFGIHAGQD